MNRIFSPYEQTQLARYGRQTDFRVDEMTAPVEYLTGKCEFLGHVFEVTPDTLIPRVETEDLVRLALTKLSSSKKKIVKFADVGTGCGAIGVSIAFGLLKKDHIFEGYLSDVSESAVAVAKKNVASLGKKTPGLKKRLHLLKSDLLKSHTQKYDLIVANLPYIPSQRIAYLEPSVKDHEPKIALDGGDEGLSLIFSLLKQAPDFLLPGGIVLLEVDHTHSMEDFKKAFPTYEFTQYKDENGQVRFYEAHLPH